MSLRKHLAAAEFPRPTLARLLTSATAGEFLLQVFFFLPSLTVGRRDEPSYAAGPDGDNRAPKSPAKTAGVVLTQSSTATNGNAVATGASTRDMRRQNAPIRYTLTLPDQAQLWFNV